MIELVNATNTNSSWCQNQLCIYHVHEGNQMALNEGPIWKYFLTQPAKQGIKIFNNPAPKFENIENLILYPGFPKPV